MERYLDVAFFDFSLSFFLPFGLFGSGVGTQGGSRRSALDNKLWTMEVGCAPTPN